MFDIALAFGLACLSWNVNCFLVKEHKTNAYISEAKVRLQSCLLDLIPSMCATAVYTARAHEQRTSTPFGFINVFFCIGLSFSEFCRRTYHLFSYLLSSTFHNFSSHCWRNKKQHVTLKSLRHKAKWKEIQKRKKNSKKPYSTEQQSNGDLFWLIFMPKAK